MAKEPSSDKPAATTPGPTAAGAEPNPSGTGPDDAEATRAEPALARKRRRKRQPAAAPARVTKPASLADARALTALRRQLDALRQALPRLQPRVMIGRRPLADVVREQVPKLEMLAKQVRKHDAPLRKLGKDVQGLRAASGNQRRVLTALQSHAKAVDKRWAELAALADQLGKLRRRIEALDETRADAQELARAAHERVQAAEARFAESLNRFEVLSTRLESFATRLAQAEQDAVAERARIQQRLVLVDEAAAAVRGLGETLQREQAEAARWREDAQRALAAVEGRLSARIEPLQAGLATQQKVLQETAEWQAKWRDLEQRLDRQLQDLGQRIDEDRIRALEALQTELPKKLVQAGLDGWKAAVGEARDPMAALANALRDRLLEEPDIRSTSAAYEDLLRRRFDETALRLDTLTTRYRIWMLVLVMLAAGWAWYVN